MKYNTFIFDFDFTLADASTGIALCVNYGLEKAGLEPAGFDEIRKGVGKTLYDIFYDLTGITDSKAGEQFFSDFIYKADSVMTENTFLYDDSISVLSMLKKKGYNTGIVTTKLHRRIDEVLVKFNITKLIDYIVGYEDVQTPKPSPEGLNNAIDFFGNNKSSVLYIGDSLIDANTALNASVDFAAVLTGTTLREEFLDLPHINISENLTELFEYLFN
jgi:phosphoglycolate phosphatase